MPAFDPRTTALVLIDLQNGITALPLAPRSGPDVVAAGMALAAACRTAGATVVLVNVAFAPDFADALRQPVDAPTPRRDMPPAWSELVAGLAQPGDLHITKRQWGAFHGTELDLQLRRRGIRTILLGGIATNIGVESTARQAWEHGYEVVFVEDAAASFSAEAHDFAVRVIFPRIARVVRAADVQLGAERDA